MLPILAELHDPSTWSFVGILIAIIVIASAVAILVVALNYFGMTIPPFVVRIFWIVVCAVLAILAIKFIASIW